jgi:hypothetical protein
MHSLWWLRWIPCDGSALGDYKVHVEPIAANRRATYKRKELLSETGIPGFLRYKGSCRCCTSVLLKHFYQDPEEKAHREEHMWTPAYSRIFPRSLQLFELCKLWVRQPYWCPGFNVANQLCQMRKWLRRRWGSAAEEGLHGTRYLPWRCGWAECGRLSRRKG